LRLSAIILRLAHSWCNGTKSDATTAKGRSASEMASATTGKMNAASSAYPSAATAATGMTATTATKPSTSATATVTGSPCDRA
jgi:hypothetical protein